MFNVASVEIEWPLNVAAPSNEGRVLCGFRPEDAQRGSPTTFRGKVAAVESLGSAAYAQLELSGKNGQLNPQPITVQLDPHLELPKLNDLLTIGINPDRLHWFDSTTGKRL
jgi:ABC-type sugar transport system ATPase subunit